MAGRSKPTSAGEGKGSTFTVRLPIRAVRIAEESEQRRRWQAKADANEVPPDPSAIGPPASAGPSRRPARARRRRRSRRPAGAGHGAGTSRRHRHGGGSVREAIEALPKAHPDVLVSDLGMPDQDGFDLIRQVRDDGHDARDLPAVALTAFVQKDDARLALLAGFQVHVPKPVDPHDLTSVIASLAGRPGSSGWTGNFGAKGPVEAYTIPAGSRDVLDHIVIRSPGRQRVCAKGSPSVRIPRLGHLAASDARPA